MTVLLLFSVIGLVLAVVPAAIFACNLSLFRRLPRDEAAGLPLEPVSVLIPARNEEATIGPALQTVLANEGIDFEVIVLDDHSEDGTAAIVRGLERHDSRVRLALAPPLPLGWCGKQHACQVLADLARYDRLLWMDADVRLSPDALRRMAAEMARRPIDLLSGFPHEETGTGMEALQIPLIHFILLGYLPLGVMRRTNQPGLGAGCGQLFMAGRSAYVAAGGHAAIRASLHDGLKLPRSFRTKGCSTDLFDASDLARCRMYRSASEVWMGLLKNAGEGMASPLAIGPWTLLLVGGQIMPPVLVLILALATTVRDDPDVRWALGVSLLATGLSLTVRAVAAVRFRQSWPSVFAHSIGITLFLVIQWQSLLMRWQGKTRTWKGRLYGPTAEINCPTSSGRTG
ncbi:glycosyltransferase family A protein [Singulisphaera sp. Ch08]|uniref:Glycosyltransferase family A protein n=1 Tax=Singulisphaera sp. Ch08 TaxID=3120278 RepID=A0AAU7CAC4_9BACT